MGLIATRICMHTLGGDAVLFSHNQHGITFTFLYSFTTVTNIAVILLFKIILSQINHFLFAARFKLFVFQNHTFLLMEKQLSVTLLNNISL